MPEETTSSLKMKLYGGTTLFEQSGYASKLKQIAVEILPDKENFDYLIFYGELFGGRIQVGVDYGETVQFRLFDIALASQDKFAFVDFSEMEELAEKYEIPIVPKIAEGQLNDLLNLQAQFDSTILKKQGNLAEGYVIKHYKEPEFLDTEEPYRKMIKYKNPKFDEMTSGKKSKPKPVETSITPEFQIYIDTEFRPQTDFYQTSSC